MHGIVLSTLLDLCDNPNAQFYILSWRDAAGQTAPRLLLKLWREEEKELGVIRNQDGGITGKDAFLRANQRGNDETVRRILLSETIQT